MRQLTRRELLERTAGPWPPAAGAWRPRAAWAIPPIGRTRPSHLKLSIAAYSYRQYLTGKAAQVRPVRIRQSGRRHGPRRRRAHVVLLPARRHDRLPESAQAARLHAGPGHFRDRRRQQFCLPPGPKRDEEIAERRAWIDRAAELDAPVIRIFAGNVAKGSTEDQAVAWAIEGIKAVLRTPPRKGSCWRSRITAASPPPRSRS